MGHCTADPCIAFQKEKIGNDKESKEELDAREKNTVVSNLTHNLGKKDVEDRKNTATKASFMELENELAVLEKDLLILEEEFSSEMLKQQEM